MSYLSLFTLLSSWSPTVLDENTPRDPTVTHNLAVNNSVTSTSHITKPAILVIRPTSSGFSILGFTPGGGGSAPGYVSEPLLSAVANEAALTAMSRPSSIVAL